MINEHIAVYINTVRVCTNGIDLKPSSPNVAKIIPKTVSAHKRSSKVLLGDERQK